MRESVVQQVHDLFQAMLRLDFPPDVTEEEAEEAWRRACGEAGRMDLLAAIADVRLKGLTFSDGVRLGRAQKKVNNRG